MIGKLPNGWELRTLGDVSDIFKGGTPRRNVERYFQGNIAWATPTDITNLNGALYIDDTATHISEEALGKSAARLLPAGTVLLTSRATIGMVAIARAPMATNQGFANFLCKREIINVYLAYYLRSITNLLISLGTGTTFLEVTKATLLDIEIPLPPFPTQRKIADILSAYDDLIEINRQRIALLERAGREIYREWFVRLRFPGYEHTKIVDGVPDGWEQHKVGTLLGRISSKKKIKKNDYLDTGLIPCVDQSREFIGGYTDDVDAIHEAPLPIIIFGDHTRIVKFIDFPFARGADGTQLLIPNRNDMSVVQFYFALKAIDLSNYFYARHFKFLKHQMMLVPPKALGDKFTEFTSELMKQIKCLREHNRELSRARDLLLPRLMSGQLSV